VTPIDVSTQTAGTPVAVGWSPAGLQAALSPYPLTAATTTTVSASPEPSVSGQPVTFTAAVAGAGGTPTGTVTFTLSAGSCAGGQTQPVSGGSAQCVVDGLTSNESPVQVVAAYGGDTSFRASTSDPYDHVVSGTQTTTVVTAPVSNSAAGNSVTYTATVTPQEGKGTPTGGVQFRFVPSSGPVKNACGTVALSGGRARCTTFLSAAGSPWTVEATYLGDATFLSSTGSLAHGVRPDMVDLQLQYNAATHPDSVTALVLHHAPHYPVSGTVDFVVTANSGSATGCKGGDVQPTTGHQADCVLQPRPGPHASYTVTATYSGDPNNSSASAGPFTFTTPAG
jgi:hypothetical protein